MKKFLYVWDDYLNKSDYGGYYIWYRKWKICIKYII